ncbi:IS1634 family transposase [Heyndrickxia coagulans]|uniref:IS1634 family transposase n=1 Tax=Heyndrickxia coagulans TaxID=1398 RepID=UPI000DF3D64E|nr:IS1634 family transposase [Heyndrickxia coagulans]RCS34369.1 IS1634 family transposase [Heyndrickxia coagulans]
MSDQILTLHVGPSQLLSKLCDEIELEKTINNLVKWDSVRCHISPGTRIKALVLNILCSGKPLYKVHEFYQNLDSEMLFDTSISPDQLNDDALGRALDYLYKAEAWKVYSTLALKALKKLNLPIGVLHNDTTSISVYGEYKQPKEDGLQITYGYSKAHRPDLKQIVLGMGVTPERIPILAKVENGNTSDKSWNVEFIQKMRKILSHEDWKNLIYQADSALITTENLAEIQQQNLSFISRLPDTFGLSTELKKEAWLLNNWERVGSLSNKKDAAIYQIQAFERQIQNLPYRFLVVHSNNLDQRKEKTLNRAIEKEEIQLKKEIEKLSKVIFHCKEDALEAIQSFKKKQKASYFCYKLNVQMSDQPIKRKKRGRPKKDEQTKREQIYQIQLESFEKDHDFIENKKKMLSTFVLITNKLDEETLSNQEVLRVYKGQSAAETRFRLIKDSQMIDAIYLKTPERVEALGIVYVMALLIYGILEYRVRKELKEKNLSLILKGKRKLSQPTGQALLEQLEDITVILINQNQQKIRLLPDNIDSQAKKIIELCGYDLSIYASKNVENQGK